MKIGSIQKAFVDIGADFTASPVERRSFGSRAFRTLPGLRNARSGREQDPRHTIDVKENTHDGTFMVNYAPDHPIDIQVLNKDPKDRHLLLLVKEGSGIKKTCYRYLCGHDERHWFVSGVPGSVSTVAQAKQALKPNQAVEAQVKAGVRKKDINKRHNKGWLRQGEWFFIPEPKMDIKPIFILKDEPLQRGRGKPHMCEELYRVGGQTVYVNASFAPNGISHDEWRTLVNSTPRAKKASWRTMVRNPTVYVRGRIKHQDHATVIIPFWHRVSLNSEIHTKSVAFLD